MSTPLAAVDRTGFEILERCAYLNSAVKGALHQNVRASLEEYLDEWDRLGAPWDSWLQALEDCRAEYAALVGVDAQHVFATGSVSTGLASLLTSLDYTTRDEVVVVADDFPTIFDVVQGSERLGARVRTVRSPTGSEDLLELLAHAVNEKTRAVVVQWVHHVGRYVLDLDAFAGVCHARGALAVVDGYHGVGVLPLDLSRTKVDVLICGAMKYLLAGAGGLALAYCSPDVSVGARPLLAGWLGSADPFGRDRSTAGPGIGARRFEAGLNSVADAFMLRASLGLVSSWDMRSVAEHACHLADELGSTLIDLGAAEVRIAGPSVAARVPDVERTVAGLESRGVVAGSWGPWIRFSCHGYNNGADIAAAADGFRKVQAH